MNIKAFCIARESDKSILFVNQIDPAPPSPTEDLTLIESHLMSRYFTEQSDIEATQKICIESNKTLEYRHETEGIYYVYIDELGILYAVQTSNEFPLNLAKKLLNHVKRELKNMPGYEKQSKKSIQTFAKGFLLQIIASYSTDSSVNDAIENQKQIEIDDVEIQIHNALKFNTHSSCQPSNFSTTDPKQLNDSIEMCLTKGVIQPTISIDAADAAQLQKAPENQFLQNQMNEGTAQKHQQDMLRNGNDSRNLKIKIISAVVILSIVLYIVVPLL